ncbi:MAG: formylglycine-generating enzyme family protein [Desulfobulbaceae bacterium]|nr:formylglycine-generating enzyme family protein [Desulfobulbaceae bacterium]
MIVTANEQEAGAIRRTGASRADLIEFLARAGMDGLKNMACFAGFAPPEEKKTKPPAAPVPSVQRAREEKPPAVVLTAEGKAAVVPDARFFYVSGYEEVKPDSRSTMEPVWLAASPGLRADDSRIDPLAMPPKPLPLVPWSRLWPFLRTALGERVTTRRIDLGRVVDSIARGRVVRYFPYRQRIGWARSCQILVDCHERLLPCWDDFHGLCRGVARLRGLAGLEILKLENGPNGPCRNYFKADEPLRPYTLPGPGTPLLVLSDLGCLDDDGARRNSWLRFGRLLQNGQVNAVALTVSPRRRWRRRLAGLFFQACWDRGARLPRRLAGQRPQPVSTVVVEEFQAERLLALLAPAVLVEPALLRAARYLLPTAACDVGGEAAAWHHRDVIPTPNYFVYAGLASRQKYRAMFREFSSGLQQQVMDLLTSHHAHLPPAILFEELGFPNRGLLRRLVKTARHGADRTLQGWVRRLGQRQPPERWQNTELLALWALVHKKEIEQGTVELPPGCNPLRVSWVFGSAQNIGSYSLRQVGEHFVLEQMDSPDQKGREASGPGTPVSHAPLPVILPMLTIEGPQSKSNDLPALQRRTIPICRRRAIPQPERTPLVITTDHVAVTIDVMTRPSWAHTIGRDQYGLYVEFTVGAHTQRLRWLQPGRFLMGSPPDEPERYDDELQHEVVLSQGFWLADTACTQGLWQAVMGENPSRFTGNDNLPVDAVSWDDSMEFIGRINRLIPGLDLRLPSEAQWEYACRAGTTTPFSFGEQISTDQVNFDGNSPYHGGQKGGYRQKTVAVKSLPGNDWGLYEMHGNLWEWCADWQGDYVAGTVTDPQGPATGVGRVLRGGCWLNYGRFVRSALRRGHVPGHRSHDFGLRLSRGQKAGPDRQGEAGAQGRTGAAERAGQLPGPGAENIVGMGNGAEERAVEPLWRRILKKIRGEK